MLLSESEDDFLDELFERMQEASRGLPPTKRRPRARRGQKKSDDRSDSFASADLGWRPGPGIARPRTWREPASIKDSLSRVVWKRQWGESISLGTIISQWPTIVGSAVAAHSQVESIEEGKILVRADSTAWAKQLQLLLPQIEKRVGEELGASGDYNVVIKGPVAPSWKKGKFVVKGRGPRDTYG